MKLSNRTILLIGNEPSFTFTIIKHFTKMNNKIVLFSNAATLLEKIRTMYPDVILLHLDIYEESDRLKLVEELNNRYLSPSCVIYNEFSFSDGVFKYVSDTSFQTRIEAFYTSLTHFDECLLPFLETEADATVAYIFPKISWSRFKHRKLLFILKRTMINYINLLNTIHPYIRFLIVKYPLHHYKIIVNKEAFYEKQNQKFIVNFKRLLENYHYPSE